LRQTSGTLEADDYRGVPAIISYRWLPERELCLIVKLDQAEAYAPARKFGEAVFAISILALSIAAALAVTLSRSLTRPILALQAEAARFGQGELDAKLPETSHD
jgi:methyl-accepting chemotaxis protein